MKQITIDFDLYQKELRVAESKGRQEGWRKALLHLEMCLQEPNPLSIEAVQEAFDEDCNSSYVQDVISSIKSLINKDK